ncbi:Hint domain-containing protein [Roseovarius sp. SCSIO 43702]|uniref:Hint domain-containing protein n=1 Tax=Roseovarius sp. SCSIO 43702 TaxID=2823043 RepID=UPI001C73654D|nr:Hint domain-containing protein [Roseovarius sp. SCSIO 43702]QYX56105.1 Hint domain-containing protein [Roseovarius sp. SCSIO 43702]
MFGRKTALSGARERIREKRQDTGGALHLTSGIIAGTLVATPRGWRRVETLEPGDRVLTFDNGMQEVTRVDRQVVWTGEAHCPRDFWAVDVPAEMIGNDAPVRLLPGQALMVESDEAEMLYGDAFVVIPARALADVPGVERSPIDGRVTSVVLRFASEEVVFSKSGALYLCAASRDFLDFDANDGGYEVLPDTLARDVIAAMAPGEAPLRQPAA